MANTQTVVRNRNEVCFLHPDENTRWTIPPIGLSGPSRLAHIQSETSQSTACGKPLQYVAVVRGISLDTVTEKQLLSEMNLSILELCVPCLSYDRPVYTLVEGRNG